MNFNNILDLLSYIEKPIAERIDIATGEFKNMFVNYMGYFNDFENKIKTLYKASEKNNWLFFDSKINIDKTSITLKEDGFIDLFEDEKKNNSLKETVKDLIQQISKNIDFQSKIKETNTKIKLAKFLIKYKEQIFKDNSIYNNVCIYYGNIEREEFYFLLLLYAIGFDIIIISPGGKGYECIYTENYITDSYKEISLIDAISIGKENKKIVSAAKIIEQQVKNMLYDNSSTIKENNNQYEIEPILYDCTISDIYGMLNEDARLREGYEIIDNKIQLPHICMEINGCYEDLFEYQRLLKHIDESDDIVYKDFLEVKLAYSPKLESAFALFKRDKEKRKTLFDFRANEITIKDSTKSKILDVVIDLMNNAFKRQLDNKEKTKLVETGLFLDEKFIKMYENFDGIKQVPKVCFRFLEDCMNLETIFLILILSALGFDVIVLNIQNPSLLRSYIKNDYFSRIDLEVANRRYMYEEILELKKKKFFGLF